MKKYLLLFTSLIFSLSFFNFKTYAAVEDYPNILIKLDYSNTQYYQENANTYEYLVNYTIDNVFNPYLIGDNDYYLISNLNVFFRKGINRNTYSYEVVNIYNTPDNTSFQFHITLLKSYVNENYSSPYNIVSSDFFMHNTGIYITHIIDEESPDYKAGHDKGYDEGYDKGKEDVLKEPPMSFVNNLHVWLVPAIIIVVIAGIFVGYRREDE